MLLTLVVMLLGAVAEAAKCRVLRKNVAGHRTVKESSSGNGEENASFCFVGLSAALVVMFAVVPLLVCVAGDEAKLVKGAATGVSVDRVKPRSMCRLEAPSAFKISATAVGGPPIFSWRLKKSVT